MKTALTIAGSDCSGGAGIQADIKTMITNGVYAMSAITALTAQNTTGVTAIMESTPEFLGEQLESIFTDIYPDAVKIGMVSSSSLIKTISDKLKKYDAKNIVVDPVMVATSGAKLISDEAVSTLKEHLFPLATVLTPNIPEAEVLSEMKISNEEEMIKAGNVVPKPVNYADELRVFFNKRVTPVKAHFYQRGTPRFFDYMILDSPMDIVPSGDTDGVVELIFSTRNDALDSIKEFSRENEHALVFAVFNNTKDIIGHLYEINKCDYILSKVLIDKNDKVAISEVKKHKEYEELKLNKAITDNLFSYNKNVTWVYRGVEQEIMSHRDFNSLISRICDEVYYNTPIMNNELFNKHKLSSQITSAKAKYLKALVGNNDEIDLGFDPDKFPPEKTISRNTCFC